MMLPADTNQPSSSFILPELTCQRFTLANIQSATNNFDEILVVGGGGFGKVYKSSSKIFFPLTKVAIKRLHSMSDQGTHEFEAEVKILSRLRHGNLVSLIGYCNERNEKALVYEFMQNGTLEDHLHKGDTDLSWIQRLKICIGVARGLDYLHTGTSTQHGVIHRDVKTSNILLDVNFAAKISDFGLAKVAPINQTRTFVRTGVKGTFGYLDPCYFYTGKLTRKSDVYAFGVVLFEVVSGKQAVDPTIDEDQWSLAAWAQDQIKGGKLSQIIDDRLMGQISKKGLKEFISIAGRCLHNQPKQRPTMAEVVVKLESILLQEREFADFGLVVEGRLRNKVRYFFRGKSELMRPRAYRIRKSDSQSRIGTSKLNLKLEEFNHPNLVNPLAHSLNDQELSCTSELIQDESLDELLFGESCTTSLSWIARLKIAVGAARGLSFLHQRRHPAYSQFKSTYILVDSDYNARLTDFEVDSSFVAHGSYSFLTDARYAAPEWFRYQADIKFDGLLAPSFQDGFGVKSEIYAFGVVLLEILTGMEVFDDDRPKGQQNLVKWATPLLTDEVNLGSIVDPRLQLNNCPPMGAFEVALLVSKSLRSSQDERPSMEEVLQVLCHCYEEEINRNST